LSCTNCSSPIVTPDTTTQYIVNISSLSSSCNYTLALTVVVDPSCVWPGDTDTNKVVNHFDLLAIGLSYDSIGPARPNANLGWFGQPGALNWDETTPGTSVDLKHVDTDGNGTINADDTLAIDLNWGLMHQRPGEAPGEYQFTDEAIISESVAMAPFYVEVDTFMEGETIGLPIILGDVGVPINDIYGLAYTLEYDSSIVDASSVFVNFDNSWIGTPGGNMIAMHRDFYSPGIVQVGMTRIDGQVVDGYGEIARLFITIQDDILLRSGDTRSLLEGLNARFDIRDVLIINRAGAIIPVEPAETNSLLTDQTTSTNELDLDEFVSLFPNPAQDQFFIQTPLSIESVHLYNVLGQSIKEVLDGERGYWQISTADLGQGTYWVNIRTKKGQLTKRLVLLK
ncbi:MAG: T9SS type A sorting domain-containing protein, partial [Bacteroidota bacterium]